MPLSVSSSSFYPLSSPPYSQVLELDTHTQSLPPTARTTEQTNRLAETKPKLLLQWAINSRNKMNSFHFDAYQWVGDLFNKRAAFDEIHSINNNIIPMMIIQFVVFFCVFLLLVVVVFVCCVVVRCCYYIYVIPNIVMCFFFFFFLLVLLLLARRRLAPLSSLFYFTSLFRAFTHPRAVVLRVCVQARGLCCWTTTPSGARRRRRELVHAHASVTRRDRTGELCERYFRTDERRERTP